MPQTSPQRIQDDMSGLFAFDAWHGLIRLVATNIRLFAVRSSSRKDVLGGGHSHFVFRCLWFAKWQWCCDAVPICKFGTYAAIEIFRLTWSCRFCLGPCDTMIGQGRTRKEPLSKLGRSKLPWCQGNHRHIVISLFCHSCGLVQWRGLLLRTIGFTTSLAKLHMLSARTSKSWRGQSKMLEKLEPQTTVTPKNSRPSPLLSGCVCLDFLTLVPISEGGNVCSSLDSLLLASWLERWWMP